ncbi:hypothetical protein JCM10599A_09910 [Paraburkholderia kururiensis]
MRELLSLLVAGVAVDVEVVSRELGLTGAMSERLRRALDRLQCVEGLLQAMRSAPREGDEAVDAVQAVTSAVVEELAAKWPQDYPADAVEWLLLAGSSADTVRSNVPAAHDVATVASALRRDD